MWNWCTQVEDWNTELVSVVVVAIWGSGESIFLVLSSSSYVPKQIEQMSASSVDNEVVWLQPSVAVAVPCSIHDRSLSSNGFVSFCCFCKAAALQDGTSNLMSASFFRDFFDVQSRWNKFPAASATDDDDSSCPLIFVFFCFFFCNCSCCCSNRTRTALRRSERL